MHPMKFFAFFFCSVLCGEEHAEVKKPDENPLVNNFHQHLPVPALVDIVLDYYSGSPFERSIILSKSDMRSHIKSAEALPFLVATGSVAFLPFLDQSKLYSLSEIAHSLTEAARNNHFSMISNIALSKNFEREFHLKGIMISMVESGNLEIFKRFFEV